MENDNAQEKPSSATPPPKPSTGAAPPPQPAASSPPPQPSQPPAKPESADPYETTSVNAPAAMDGADATFGQRALAYLIDVAVVIGINILCGILVVITAFVSDALASLLGSVSWLIGVAYFATRDCLPFMDGLSIGKKAMKIRAVSEDGKPLTGNYQAGILRNVVFFIPFFVIVEAVILYTRQDKNPIQRLGDEWFKTKVIKTA
ncbi:MAG: RDD family protein [Verrucomicrobiales bacterium]